MFISYVTLCAFLATFYVKINVLSTCTLIALMKQGIINHSLQINDCQFLQRSLVARKDVIHDADGTHIRSSLALMYGA